MQFERGKSPETQNTPYRAARIKDERWRSAGPGFEPGRASPRLSLTSSQDELAVGQLQKSSEAVTAPVDQSTLHRITGHVVLDLVNG
jgi:hypothetical protein